MYRKFESFFDIIAYARRKPMCTSLGCTTCGSGEFRRFIANIVGREQLVELITSMSEETVRSIFPDFWYEPFRVILVDFPELEELDCPFCEFYRELRDYCLRIKAERKARGDALQKAQQEAAAPRKEKHRIEAEAHRKRSEEKRRLYYENLKKQQEAENNLEGEQ